MRDQNVGILDICPIKKILCHWCQSACHCNFISMNVRLTWFLTQLFKKNLTYFLLNMNILKDFKLIFNFSHDQFPKTLLPISNPQHICSEYSLPWPIFRFVSDSFQWFIFLVLIFPVFFFALFSNPLVIPHFQFKSISFTLCTHTNNKCWQLNITEHIKKCERNENKKWLVSNSRWHSFLSFEKNDFRYEWMCG